MDSPNECPKCHKPKNNNKQLCDDCSKLPVDGKRHVIKLNGKRYYLLITDMSIMFSGPGESSSKDREFFELINLVCRLSSKLRSNGAGWRVIIKQFESVNVTNGKTVVREILALLKQL